VVSERDHGYTAEEAYRDYRGAIYRFLLRKTGDHHDAEDLTQRVFADCAAALKSEAAQPRSILAWLYATAERRFVDDVRRRVVARRNVHLLRSDDIAPDMVYSAEVSAALREAIARLPTEQRLVVVMKVLEGQPFSEIAHKLEITEAACKMRLSRAISQIKADLSAKGLGPND
jgi:RNA polymerase sigma factor (sigma-70 family)